MLGQRPDAHAAPLSTWLFDRGAECDEVRVVGDDERAIESALGELSEGRQLLIVTGGLGPTDDDVTAAALLRATGLVEAYPLHNECGTAPGLLAVLRGCVVACLPGPPNELWPMVTGQLEPVLRSRGLVGATRVARCIHACGIGESAAAKRLGGLIQRGRDPTVGITVSEGVVSARIRGSGRCDIERVEADARLIRSAWGDHVFGEGATTLPAVIGAELLRRRHRVGTAESCSGGLVAAALTDVAGSSEWFQGGIVSYANEIKRSLVQVPEETLASDGAVSGATARAMASGALAALGVDWAVSTTGIAGPGGGTPEKPVGTLHVGIAWRDAGAIHATSRQFALHGTRAMVRQRTVSVALTALWWELRALAACTLLWERPS